MTTIDAHTHAWGENSETRPWVGDDLPPDWSGAYTHEGLIDSMDAADVDEAVVVTPPLYGRGPAANEYTFASIAAHPDRLWGVGTMDFFAADAVDRLRRLVGRDRILGVRMHAALRYDPVPSAMDRTTGWILDDRLRPIWETASELGTTVFVFPKAQQLCMIETILKGHPGITVVIDHMAWPDGTTAPDEPPWTRLRALAAHPNVYMKLSSLPRSSAEGWPYSDLHPYVRRLVEWFGSDRLMIGSDYPWMDRWAGYGECVSWLDECDGLSTGDRAWIRHQTFRGLFG
ncbi:amidohydrolase [Halococcus morrhuae DSM 1307]|uniref:Amidohydrolase n=1 Tax=Halococcus morrhuae DSM 1307 TaxID=931277 RepID=M0MME3_HALMO|nr:amidohydrolase family protein [Halococcus morrhuae]EMA46846.1 amidohydrolase [Halococcus morrhuae DSM 1307]